MGNARQSFEEAGEDTWPRALALGVMGKIEMQAARDLEARTNLLESIEGLRATGDLANEFMCLLDLASLKLYTHEFEGARRLAASVLDKAAAADQIRKISGLNTLGFALVGLGRHRDAREAFAQSLELVLTSGLTGEGALQDALAGTAYGTEKARFHAAAQLLGTVHRLTDEAGLNRGPRQRELDRFFAQPLIDALGEAAYLSEQEQGAAMSLDEAIDLARSLLAS
jgi:tetratricopeptide (TPR) repeat protein